MFETLQADRATDPGTHSEPLRVLVVEDGKSVAEVLAMFFEMEGMKTAIALDGVEAVAAVESFHPHLICMDLTMPRMDGFEAARRIRKIRPDVMIVALCGIVGEEARRQTKAAGFDLHLVKPVAPDDLRRMIEQCLPAIAGKHADITSDS